ncbi:MAG: universal stress protein [Rubrobacteraceae bacterium]
MTHLPEKVLVAMDGSEGSALAAQRAVGMARAFGAELHVVHVMPEALPYPDSSGFVAEPISDEEEVQWARELLEEQVKKIEERGGEVKEAHLRRGNPDAEVIALAEEIGAGLIVVGSRGLNQLRRLRLGSVSSSIAAHAHCPVLVIRDESRQDR